MPKMSKWDDIKVEYLNSNDHIKLAYRQLKPKNPQKALILIPGVTMYGYYYIPLMKEISNKNILIRVIDLRGHGDSEGKRGDVPNKDSLIKDLQLHINDLEQKYQGIEIFIGGHSMGAGICGRFIEKNQNVNVKGVIHLAPFFHYRQSGMKNSGFLKVDIFKLLFGKDHDVTHTYNPAGNDQKLVKTYTKIMSKVTMVEDYNEFKKNDSIKSLLIIGKKDELFEWKEMFKDFDDNANLKKVAVENETHLGIILNSTIADYMAEWIK